MNLPSIDDYINALHFDTALAQYAHLEPVKKDDGSLYFSSGNFAVVFKMRCKNTGKFFALKVFHRYQEGRIESYKLISECLENNTSDYLVKYHFLEKEIWVNSHAGDAEYPAIVMDWVEGKTLGNTLQDLCKKNNFYSLKRLAYAFDEMALWLLKQEFAHGDLKSDNILVDSQKKQLKLVDYDGLYTPAMAGQKARENGSPHFRHPKRDVNHFGKHIDDFSLLLLSLSLHTLAQEPNLIGQHGAGDSILFTENELANPGQSNIWQNLTKHLSNTAIAPRYALLHMACASPSNARVLGLENIINNPIQKGIQVNPELSIEEDNSIIESLAYKFISGDKVTKASLLKDLIDNAKEFLEVSKEEGASDKKKTFFENLSKNTQKVVDNFENYFNKVKELVESKDFKFNSDGYIESLIGVSKEDVDNYTTEAEEESNQQMIDDFAAKENRLASAPGEVRRLLAYVPAYDANGKPILNSISREVFAPIDFVFSQLIEILCGEEYLNTEESFNRMLFLMSKSNSKQIQHVSEILSTTQNNQLKRKFFSFFRHLFPTKLNTVTDIDGNVYNTVKIGTQTWMTENLKTTRYNDGTSIPLVTTNSIWANGETPMMCYYDNDITFKATYGALYNWHAVNTKKLCPKGWHVPTDTEWETLIDFLGGEEVAGSKLKAITDWESCKNNTNKVGFSALPSGYRSSYSYGTFHYFGFYGGWWSASTNGASFAWYRIVLNGGGGVFRYDSSQGDGLSVRCVRD
jgi:uncharacterized protein (TIGR02145 family)